MVSEYSSKLTRCIKNFTATSDAGSDEALLGVVLFLVLATVLFTAGMTDASWDGDVFNEIEKVE